MQTYFDHYAEEVPVTGGIATVTYIVHVTANVQKTRHGYVYNNGAVDDVEIQSMNVYAGGGIEPVENSPDEIGATIDQMLLSQPDLSDIMVGDPESDDDHFSTEPNERQKQDAINYFWNEIADSQELRSEIRELLS